VHISSRGGGPCSSDTVRRKRRCRIAILAVLVFCVVGLAGYLKQRHGKLDHLLSENRDLAGEALQGLVCETFRRLFNLTAQTCLEWDSHCHVYFS
jgi:hypothetical protein